MHTHLTVGIAQHPHLPQVCEHGVNTETRGPALVLLPDSFSCSLSSLLPSTFLVLFLPFSKRKCLTFDNIFQLVRQSYSCPDAGAREPREGRLRLQLVQALPVCPWARLENYSGRIRILASKNRWED